MSTQQLSLLTPNPPTYSHAIDAPRLDGQRDVVLALMRDAKWRTLAQIESAAGAPQASISARLRDLRKARWGGWTVTSQRKAPGSGTYIYRGAAGER